MFAILLWLNMAAKEGKKAPEFITTNQKGETISLASFQGRKVVLYFYPKDNTPTCAIEACNLRDNYRFLLKQGYVVLGISPDSAKKHLNFIAKFNLPFDLLVDAEHKIALLYGVWGEKMLFGRKYMGILRTTFVINENGIIEEVIDKVESARHAGQLLK